MTRSASAASGPRILPVVMVGLALFGLAKAADLWIGFSSAGAADIEAAVTPTAAVDDAPDDRLLEQLAGRRVELDRREDAIETREALLQATESRIERRLAELDLRESEAAAAEQVLKADEAAQFAKLSDAYERMKPRDAARIFEALDAELLGPVAAGMRTQSLASVLGEMEAEKAKRLTELLARRQAQEPAQP